ncbi:MAG: hypothetical protein ACRDWG_16385 [Actinomycetes bacterium]|jgi:hypothetical protein
MVEPRAPGSPDQPVDVRERVARNVLTFGAVVAPAFAIAKIFVVTNFDLDTTLAVMQGAGAVNVAVTALVASLPTLVTWLMLAIPVAAFWVYEPGGPATQRWLALHRDLPLMVQALLVFSFAVALFIAPWPVVLTWIGLLAASIWLVPAVAARARAAAGSLGLTSREAAQLRTERRFQGLRRLLAIGSGVLLIAALLIDPRPWMPAERLTAPDGRVAVGYVVSDGEWIRLLTEPGRRIEIYRTDQISARKPCRIAPPSRYASPFELVRGLLLTGSRTPVEKLDRCPDLS